MQKLVSRQHTKKPAEKVNNMMDDNQDSDDEAIVRASIKKTQGAILELMMDEDEGFLDDEDDSSRTPFERHIRRYQHTARPRKKKRIFNHDRAFDSIQTDYLGPDPLFIGSNFKSIFRISRTRFQRMLEDVGNLNLPFYQTKEHLIGGVPTCSLQVKLLLTLKNLAFGVATHCFTDYFQMSTPMAAATINNFDIVMAPTTVDGY